MEYSIERQTSIKIAELIKQKKYDEAIELCKKYPNDEVIQSQRLTIAIKQKDYKTGEEIGNRKEFRNDIEIQTQLMTIESRIGYIEGNYDKAKQIARRKEFIGRAPIQSQLITILIREENYEEAKKIGYSQPLINSPTIQSQMLTIAIIEGNLNEIQRIANRKEFIEYQPIQMQIEKVKERAEFLDEVRKKIYSNTITQEDIEKIKKTNKLSKYERTCLLLAICEKKKRLKDAKEIFEKYASKTKNPKEIQTLNAIMKRIGNPNVEFDFEFYDTSLNWNIDKIIRKKLSCNVYHSENKGTSKEERNAFVSRIEVPEQELKYNRQKIIVKRKKSRYEEINTYLKRKKRYADKRLQVTEDNEKQKAISDMKKIQYLLDELEENKENEQYVNNLYNKILKLENERRNNERSK